MQNNARHQLLIDLLDQQRPFTLESMMNAIAHQLEYTVGKYRHNLNGADIYQALAYTIRGMLVDRFNETQEERRKNNVKRVYYLSLEFLIGRMLKSSLIKLSVYDLAKEALDRFGFKLEEIAQYEPDAGLGNGGLGRLAACFLDSMATLNLPGYGAGLHYEFGMFHQQIIDGYQYEAADLWLARGNPWEFIRPDILYPIGFYGHTERYVTPTGETAVRWVPGETIMAMAHDILIPGFNHTVNNLRLWSARASSEFNLDYFNHGDYIRAVEDKQRSESISKVLYPNENVIQGKELRLKQQYLLVSATLQDALTTFIAQEADYRKIPEKMFFQLNDTHPSLAIPELMRLLVDENSIAWDEAWQITKQCMAYTNHTVLPEALEKWEVTLFGRLLPRHLEIIYLINYQFIESMKAMKVPESQIANMSIIEEWPVKKIRMANLAIIGSKSVNGVAALHSELLKKELFRDFHSITPEKFQNKTNGITHRRFIIASNRLLTALINERIGTEWHRDLNELRRLESFVGDNSFCQGWAEAKLRNKEALARIINFECGIKVDVHSMFDVQVKRIHEYKRQLLNLLRVIADYQALKQNPSMDYTPRTIIFGGKAAPGYFRAKMIIKLINAVAQVVNNDKEMAGRLKVVFLPDYRVSLAEQIFPASDLSEQISTAGTEASGTGNMKFMLNGALTVGTLDGANIEIMEEAGRENIYIFGLTVEQVAQTRSAGYDPVKIFNENQQIKAALDAIRSDFFNKYQPGLFQDIFHALTYGGDQYLLLADFPAYMNIQKQISHDFNDRNGWIKKSILNSARSGKFSSDRTIREYARDIWDVQPTPR